MVYLPADIQRTRSRNAQRLSQEQQAMGVVPTERPEAPPQPGGGVAPSSEGGFTPGGQAQPSSVREYLQAQQQQRSMLEARGQDLRLAQVMSRALDPAMPKGFRQLGLRQVSQMLGIDPRGDRAKEIINTISGLDPQSLEGIRRGIVGSTDTAQPGELTQMARGVLSGQVPPDQLLTLASSAMQPPAGAAATAGGDDFEPPMRLGGPGPGSAPSAPRDIIEAQAPGQAGAPGAPLAPRETQPARLPFQAAPTSEIPPAAREVNVPPLMREAAPELVELLGVDSTGRYRNRDIIQGGWRRIPTEGDDQRRLATDIRGNQDGVVNTISMGTQLYNLIDGRPDVLNMNVGRIPWLGNIELANPASAMVQIGNGINSFVQSIGMRGVATDPDSEAGQRVLAEANRLADRVVSMSPSLQDSANTNAIVQSLLINMAFAMAAAKGQTGRFLSDRDVELQLQELGKSASPEMFQATIKEVLSRNYEHYRTRMRAQTGGEVPLAPVVTDEARDSILRSPAVPKGFATELGGAPAPQRPVPRPPATPPPAPGPGIELDIGGERTMMPSGPTPGAAPASGPPAPEPPPPVEIPPRQPFQRQTLQRSSPTLDDEDTAARARLEEDRAARLEERAAGRRRLEIAESQEARAQRAEIEARRQRVQQAFAQIGAALRGAISTSGGGISAGGGGDQDPNAFRLTPGPQRRAPTPVPAGPFQPQLPQRRR